jgi:hypothetical protein
MEFIHHVPKDTEYFRFKNSGHEIYIYKNVTASLYA